MGQLGFVALVESGRKGVQSDWRSNGRATNLIGCWRSFAVGTVQLPLSDPVHCINARDDDLSPQKMDLKPSIGLVIQLSARRYAGGAKNHNA